MGPGRDDTVVVAGVEHNNCDLLSSGSQKLFVQSGGTAPVRLVISP